MTRDKRPFDRLIEKITELDERVADVERQQMLESISKSRNHPGDGLIVEFQQLRRQRRYQTSIHKNKRLVEILDLSNSEQRIVPTCPCGKHKGLEFFDNGRTLEVLCPVHWWISLTWLAFENGTLGDFLKSTPLEMYIGAFRL